MANKISVSINAELARQLLSTRSYKNKEGNDVKIQEIKFDLIEMKDESKKTVYDSEKFELVKTHFAVKAQSAEDRKNKVDTVFVGEGVTQVWKDDNGEVSQSQSRPQQNSNQVADDDDLPF